MDSYSGWVRARAGQTDTKDKKDNRRPRDRDAEAAGVEGTGLEFLLAPHDAAEDGRQPGQVVARHGQREERRCSGRRNQTQQAQHRGQEGAPQRRAHGDVAEGFANGAEEGAEGQRAVAAEGPGLARGGDEDADAHEELDYHEEGHHAERAVLAERVVVDLRHGLAEGRGEDGGGIGVHACGDYYCEDEAEEPAGSDRHDDAVGDGAGRVRGFFGHVHAGVECADAEVGGGC